MSRLAQYQNQVQDGYGHEEFKPIPKGTQVVCRVESGEWEEIVNQRVSPALKDEFIRVKYVVDSGEYAGRQLKQALYILGKADQDDAKNAKTEENALLMLAALDAICLQGALAKLPHDPEDRDLIKLVGKKVLITVGVNRFKNGYGEDMIINNVRMLAPVPAAGSRSQADGEERPRRERPARRPR